MKSQMPAKWRFLKVDLFDNATVEELKEDRRKFKLAFSVKTTEGKDWLYFRAAMNSPRKCYKRFVQEDWDWQHYNIVLKHHDDIKHQMRDPSMGIERINISKVYQKGFAEHKHTIEGMSAMLIQTTIGYVCKFYVTDHLITITLDQHNLTAKQRAQGIVASASVSNNTGYARKRATDFL